jgi:hypothetical protein
MKIEQVLETVFIEEFNTTAMILKDRVVVMLWNNKYVDRQGCFNHIYEQCKGWVQTSEAFREADRCGKATGISSDPILPYENLYNNLIIYAKENYASEFNCD